MAAQYTRINDFSLGMTNDVNVQNNNYARLIQNFDAHSRRNKLVPFKSAESGDDSITNRKQNFCVAPISGAGTKASPYVYGLHSLGWTNATDMRVDIKYKNLTITGAASLADNTWTAGANGSNAREVDFDLFVYYQNQDKIYGTQARRYIWTYTASSQTLAEEQKDLNDYSGVFSTAYSTSCQGLVHSKDDVLYLAFDNWIIYNNKGTWLAGTSPALTLPKHLKITSLCEYGNYLAIACAPVSKFGKSVVYLWDRDSSLTTLSESIDWGEGNIFVLEEIDGYLVGISNVGSGGTNATFNNKMVFRYYSGGKALILEEFISSEVNTALSIRNVKQKVNNYLYFLFAMTFPHGDKYEGLWKIGRNKDNTFSVTFDRSAYNDTTDNTLNNFIIVGDFVFISYINSNVYKVGKTIEIGTGEYTANSIYETIIQNGGDSALKKKLLGVAVTNEPLSVSDSGQIILKYKIDDDIWDSTASWTTIFTNGTDNSVSHSALNIESTGGALPEYREIIFRVESTGDAVITGLKTKWEIIDKDLLQ